MSEFPILDKKRNQKRLTRLLSSAPLQDLVVTIWNIDRVQSGEYDRAKFFVNAPAEIKTTDPASSYFIHKWKLESLLTSFFCTVASPLFSGKRGRILRVNHWKAIAELINRIDAIENAEAALFLRHHDVLVEFHRIGQRQFPWQRGFAHKQALHLYLSVMQCDESNAYFSERFGLTMEEFVKIGFVVWAAFRSHPALDIRINVEQLGVSQSDFFAFVNRVSETPEGARKYYVESSAPGLAIAARPSRLRTHPLLRVSDRAGEKLLAPLPDLIFYRITEGLFYDLVEEDRLKEKISNNFVLYINNIIKEGYCEFDIDKEIKYKIGKTEAGSPDLFLRKGNEISVAVECKSRRMSHPARFGEDPISQARSGFSEIAKGMVQLWRYLRDSDRQLLPKTYQSNENTLLLLITLDTWMQAAIGLVDVIIKIANELADQKEIDNKYRRPVAFAHVTELEYIVNRGNVDQIIQAVTAQNSKEYRSWRVNAIFDDINGKVDPKGGIPEDELFSAIPWSEKIPEVAKGRTR